jgi:Phage capsid family
MTMYLGRGFAFARKALAIAATGNALEAVRFASSRWGADSTPARELKSAVAGGATTDSDYSDLIGADESAAEFLEVVEGQSIQGRLQGLRKVPSGVPVCGLTGGATAYWVGSGKSIPVSRQAFARVSLRSLNVAALIVVSNELARTASARGVALMRADLIEAGTRMMDLTFVDPSNAGDDATPASITNGLTPIASSGTLQADVEAALAQFSGSLLTASWVCSPALAAGIGIRSGGKGLGCDVGAKGGMIGGIPVITSEQVAADSNGFKLILVDAARIVTVDDGIRVEKATHASIEMDTSPSADATTPTGASMLVNLFQADSAAIKVVRSVNWEVALPGSVILIDSISYV